MTLWSIQEQSMTLELTRTLERALSLARSAMRPTEAAERHDEAEAETHALTHVGDAQVSAWRERSRLQRLDPEVLTFLRSSQIGSISFSSRLGVWHSHRRSYPLTIVVPIEHIVSNVRYCVHVPLFSRFTDHVTFYVTRWLDEEPN